MNAGTGEHGVGVGKKIYLNDELGESTVALLRKIKKTIDPQNILNPGKVRASLLLTFASDSDTLPTALSG